MAEETKKTKREIIRYSSSPFTENGLDVPTKKASVKLTRLGRQDNVQLINYETGEHHGTHITTYRKVDASKFVKLFTQNIALTFDLKAAGIKAFNVLMWAVQNNAMQKDLILLDKYSLEDFLKENDNLKLSLATFWRGLAELESSQIIAKNIRAGWYYINPNFCFNGDRLVFTTLIEKESKEEVEVG